MSGRAVAAPDVRTALSASWWALFPPACVLLGRLVFEHAWIYGGPPPLELLPWSERCGALSIAAAVVYLAVHVWLCAAYILIVRRTQRLVPTWRGIQSALGTATWKAVLLATAVALEYVPVFVWRSWRG
jgi:hypothetical protein